jgi:magnesium-transporting ATPase (P-type)
MAPDSPGVPTPDVSGRSKPCEGEAMAEMNVDAADGLTDAEARARLDRYGPNEIREESSGLVRGILNRFWGPIPWMLEAALVLEVALGNTVLL